MKKLNLGCGKNIKEGYINIDLYKGDGVDIILNLEEARLPFPENSVDEIYISHALEHISNRYNLILECHRVLKPRGKLIIYLPASSISIMHNSYFHSKDYFKPIIGFDKRNGNYQVNNYFNLIYQKRRLRKPILLYFRFRNWLLNLFTDEWEYKLEKRECK